MTIIETKQQGVRIDNDWYRPLGMRGAATHTDHDPCMLDPSIGIEQPRANRADIIAHSLGRHGGKPARLYHLNIVVQQA